MKSTTQFAPPNLTDLLNAVRNNVVTEINCINIGIIQDFDVATQTATIQLALKKVLSVDTDGTRTMQERSILKVCPVMVLFGGNSFLSMPIKKGDNCIVLFNDREIDEWFENGGIQTPISYRNHDLSDAIAIVGIRSLQDSISDYLSDGIRLSYNSASRIDLSEDLIESTALLLLQNGSVKITEDLEVEKDALIKGNLHVQGGMQIDGQVTGNAGTINVDANMAFSSGKTVSGAIIQSSNGATGSFNTVTVLNGIVIGGS